MNWWRGLFRLWIVLSITWIGLSVWYVDPISQFKTLHHTFILKDAGNENRFEFPDDLPLSEIKKSLIYWAEQHKTEIKLKIANNQKLTWGEYLDDGVPSEKIADEIIGDYKPDGRTITKTSMNIAAITLLPPLAALAIGIIILWVLRGFRKKTAKLGSGIEFFLPSLFPLLWLISALVLGLLGKGWHYWADVISWAKPP